MPQPLLLKYLIIDDDETDRMIIELEAKKFPFLQLSASFTNPIEALDTLAENKHDILFLDIEMPGLSGVEFLKKYKSPDILPVLVTSHPEFALEGFELDVFDYLLKPVTSERFATCAMRLHDFCKMRVKSFSFDTEEESNSIMIKQGYDKFKIPLHDILYVEAMRDYTRVVTAEKQYLVLSTLCNFSKKLPESFIRIHRSYIVNRDKIESVKKNKISIHSHELSVGKLYKHALSFME